MCDLMCGQLWPLCTTGTNCDHHPTFACAMLSDKMNKTLLINVRIKLQMCIIIALSGPAFVKGISECKVHFSLFF